MTDSHGSHMPDENKPADEQAPEIEALWESQVAMSVGEILKKTRRHYDLSLEDVEGALRIRREQLSALENDNFESLPGRVYAIGFVRTYSEYLGLDGGKMVHIYKKQAGGKLQKPQVYIPAPASESKLPGLVILGVSFCLLVLSVVTYNMIKGDTQSADISTPAEALSDVVITRLVSPPLAYSFYNTLEAAAGDTGPVKFIKPPGRIVIQARQNSWVEIKDDQGEVLISRILKNGDSYIVPDNNKALLTTGNIGGLTFVVDGRELTPFGETGEVRRSLELDVETLRTLAGDLKNGGAGGE